MLGSAIISCAACGAKQHAAAVPAIPTAALSTTTTITGYTDAQVVGWVTPTLDNGIAFVTGLPAGAPYARVLRAAQSLSTACAVAQGELDQVSWTGHAAEDKTSLYSALSQTVALVARPTPSTFPSLLQGDIHVVSTRLSALNGDIRS